MYCFPDWVITIILSSWFLSFLLYSAVEPSIELILLLNFKKNNSKISIWFPAKTFYISIHFKHIHNCSSEHFLMMATIKSLSENSSIFVTFVLVSADCIFSTSWAFPCACYDGWLLIGTCTFEELYAETLDCMSIFGFTAWLLRPHMGRQRGHCP